MSAAISPQAGYAHPHAAWRRRPTSAWIRRGTHGQSVRGVAIASSAALLFWGFVGSLALDLRTSATSDPTLARLWLAGALLIVLCGLMAGLLAGPGREG